MWKYGEEMKGRLKARIAKIRETIADGIVNGQIVFEKGIGNDNDAWRIQKHAHADLKLDALLEQLRLLQDELNAIDRAERDAFDRAERSKTLLERLSAEEAQGARK